MINLILYFSVYIFDSIGVGDIVIVSTVLRAGNNICFLLTEALSVLLCSSDKAAFISVIILYASAVAGYKA